MAYDASLLEDAHRASMQNRDDVEKSDICACFACLVTLEPSVIAHWTDHDADDIPQTPLCPSCGTDALLASASGFPLEEAFLEAMHAHYCTHPDEELASPDHAAFATVDDARALLVQLGAAPWLLRHVELVGEAAEAVLNALAPYALPRDPMRVRLGVVFHDAGKILHPSEMSQPGHWHETSGQRLLLAQNVEPALARICVSHARWNRMELSLEELVVAVADKLWKGVRSSDLEKLVVDAVSQQRGVDPWETFVELDAIFESVAAEGDSRLARSLVSKERPRTSSADDRRSPSGSQ